VESVDKSADLKPPPKYEQDRGSCHGVAYVGRVSPEQGPQVAGSGAYRQILPEELQRWITHKNLEG
jgi:hypothetical protein